MLLGSGRLVLHPSDERRAIVLDNVFFVNQKEARLTKLLGIAAGRGQNNAGRQRGLVPPAGARAVKSRNLPE